jgi:hypothetical protein
MKGKYSYLTEDVILYENQIWVSESFVLRQCQNLTYEYLSQCRFRFRRSKPQKKVMTDWNKNYILSETGLGWRFGRWFRTFYYCFDNIPSQSPNFYRDLLPDKAELQKMAVRY